MFRDKSTEGWLKSLNRQIGIEPHLWQYYNKVFDLSPFMKSHPGGQEWLKFTQGQDITDYVETYHIDINKVNSVIDKYYVGPAPCPRKGLFEYNKNSFFNKMRQKALKLLPTRQSRMATTQMSIIAWSIVLFCVFSFILFSKNLNILTCVLYSYSLFLMLGVGHNFSHQNHILKHAFDPAWITYKDWMVSHGLSHHTYPNTKLDLQITLFHPFIYILKSQRGNRPLVRLTQFIIFFLTPIQRILNLVINPTQIIKKPQYLVLLLQPLLISYLGNNSLSTSIIYWYIAQGLNAIMFIFTTFPIHRTIQTWTEGQSQINKDFGIHILQTTSEHDLGLSTIKSFFIYLGFTDHILHHMFPAVDKSKLVLLNPIFLQTLKQMGLQKQLKLMDYGDIIQGYMKRLEPR